MLKATTPIPGRATRLAVFALVVLGLLSAHCAPEEVPDRLDQIFARGELWVLTRNNAHCYYSYRDEPMGFEYDLARAFADSLGVELKILTPRWDELVPALDQGEGDLVAASITRTEARAQRVDFCEPYLNIKQHLIRRKDSAKRATIDDLNGATIHVRRGSSYHDRLMQLQAEGLAVEIVLHEDLPTEDLIQRTAEGEIELTVADTNVALLNRRYFPEIRLGLVLAEAQSLSWALPKGETRLRERIDAFFRRIQADGTFSRIHNRYYANIDLFDYVDLRSFKRRLGTRLPKYQSFIEQAARANDFDWRLIAAVVYQESHFNPRARSHSGVRGLMQLTLSTAREMGIDNRLDPEQSVRGGVAYLRSLYDRFPEAEDPDRLYLALASYNVGRGHVLDAQALAAEAGEDPNRWLVVAETLPLLRDPRYYEQSRYGYCRGTEPVRYIQRIQTYYEILKREALDYEDAGLDKAPPAAD